MRRRFKTYTYRSMYRKFNCVRHEVFDYLLDALDVGGDILWQGFADFNNKFQTFFLDNMAKIPSDI